MSAWPQCLLPLLPLVAKHAQYPLPPPDSSSSSIISHLIQQVLLVVLGDLWHVWHDEQLSSVLLALPLAALQLLLSSDQLKTDSEDTVLYTAQKYLHVQPREQWEAVMQGLAPLIRCPLLCDLQLAAHNSSRCSTGWPQQPGGVITMAVPSILTQLLPSLRQLVQLRRLFKDHDGLKEHMQTAITAPLDSWQLGPRPVSPDHSSSSRSVSVTWKLPVEQLRAACRECSEEKKFIQLFSPVTTAPMAGMAWKLIAGIGWNFDSSGARVGLYATPMGFPSSDADVLYIQRRSIECMGISRIAWESQSKPSILANAWGNSNFFGVGFMTGAGGWDDAAWAAKGLPTEGELELKLAMIEVS